MIKEHIQIKIELCLGICLQIPQQSCRKISLSLLIRKQVFKEVNNSCHPLNIYYKISNIFYPHMMSDNSCYSPSNYLLKDHFLDQKPEIYKGYIFSSKAHNGIGFNSKFFDTKDRKFNHRVLECILNIKNTHLFFLIN